MRRMQLCRLLLIDLDWNYNSSIHKCHQVGWNKILNFSKKLYNSCLSSAQLQWSVHQNHKHTLLLHIPSGLFVPQNFSIYCNCVQFKCLKYWISVEKELLTGDVVVSACLCWRYIPLKVLCSVCCWEIWDLRTASWILSCWRCISRGSQFPPICSLCLLLS